MSNESPILDALASAFTTKILKSKGKGNIQPDRTLIDMVKAKYEFVLNSAGEFEMRLRQA